MSQILWGNPECWNHSSFFDLCCTDIYMYRLPSLRGELRWQYGWSPWTPADESWLGFHPASNAFPEGPGGIGWQRRTQASELYNRTHMRATTCPQPLDKSCCQVSGRVVMPAGQASFQSLGSCWRGCDGLEWQRFFLMWRLGRFMPFHHGYSDLVQLPNFNFETCFVGNVLLYISQEQETLPSEAEVKRVEQTVEYVLSSLLSCRTEAFDQQLFDMAGLSSHALRYALARFVPRFAAGALGEAKSELGDGSVMQLPETRSQSHSAPLDHFLSFQVQNFSDEGISRAWDLGAGFGEDAAYLVSHGLNVVTVEADPERAAYLGRVFGDRAVLLNRAVGGSGLDYSFRTFTTLIDSHLGGFGSNVMPPLSVGCADLIEEFGTPQLLKMDVEGADYWCIISLYKALRNSSSVPKYLSLELSFKGYHPAQVVRPFQRMGRLLLQLGYKRFKLVQQRGMQSLFGLSSGLFGREAIDFRTGRHWRDFSSVMSDFREIMMEYRLELDWYDLHASA